MNLNSTLGAAQAANIPQSSPLQDIARHIETEAQRLRMIADNLNNHADRLFGALPECLSPNQPQPNDTNAMDRIKIALEVLTEASNAVEHAAHRNCILA